MGFHTFGGHGTVDLLTFNVELGLALAALGRPGVGINKTIYCEAQV